MRAGLTTADKGALLDAKARGFDRAYIEKDGYQACFYVDTALAQIAEMESATQTNADHWIDLWKNDVLLMARMFVYEQKSESGDYEYLVSDPDGTEIALMDSYCEAIKRAAEFLHSPYTEGETK